MDADWQLLEKFIKAFWSESIRKSSDPSVTLTAGQDNDNNAVGQDNTDKSAVTEADQMKMNSRRRLLTARLHVNKKFPSSRRSSGVGKGRATSAAATSNMLDKTVGEVWGNFSLVSHLPSQLKQLSIGYCMIGVASVSIAVVALGWQSISMKSYNK